MASSIKDVAALAGVSVGTVSNVLNRPAVVSSATLARVHQAITDLGFVRNESARQLRAGRSHTIALVVLDSSNPFFNDVAAGAEDLAFERGLMVMVCNSHEDSTREERYLRLLEEQRVQGVLITPTLDGPSSRLEELVARGTPVVLVDRGAGRPNQCSAAVDDVLGGKIAADHLLGQGHHRLGFVGGPAGLRQVADRLRGFQDSAAGAGAEVIVYASAGLTVAQGREAAGRLAGVESSARPTAVFCANDLLSMGVLQELTQREIRIPQDVAIIGYDDIEYAAAAAIPLSSIRQPREDLGRAAVGLLLDEIDLGAAHRHRQIVFEPELVVRQSSLWSVQP
ncbi:MAG: LacI family DNA-binding transcriptional regulator [Propionibacteriales bacterium]|nr:LacI family DNA-binding transcriptional regulator [Propionibacteriales bacterium]